MLHGVYRRGRGRGHRGEIEAHIGRRGLATWIDVYHGVHDLLWLLMWEIRAGRFVQMIIGEAMKERVQTYQETDLDKSCHCDRPWCGSHRDSNLCHQETDLMVHDIRKSPLFRN